jgi:hypothetical protein
MSIIVTSNSEPVALAEKPVVQGEGEQSAPEAQAAEQNESKEPDTKENDDKEEPDESEAEESEEETEAKESDDDKPKRKSGSQRRKERAERAEAEVARLQRLVEEMALRGAGESKNEPKKAEAAPATADVEPNADDFDSPGDYLKAIVRWENKQEAKAQAQEAEKSRLKSEQEKAYNAHLDRVKSFAASKSDWSEVMNSVNDIPLSFAVRQRIVSPDGGPALMYELASNREEFERINSLSYEDAVFEMGRISSRLSAPTEKRSEPKKVTNSPRPLEPVGKGSGGSVTKSIDDPSLSQSEYEKIRRKQLEARKAAW